jgi:putative glycosyltransferase (TIGR04372 family)
MFFGLLGLLIFVLLVFLGKIFGIRFRIGRIHTQSFGHFCEEFDMVLGSLSDDMTVDLWVPMQKISNRFLWSTFKEHAITAPPLLFDFTYNLVQKCEKRAFLTEENIPSYSKFPIPRFESNRSSTILKKKLFMPYGFDQLKDPSRKIAIVCVRDSGHNEKNQNAEEMAENVGFRNNDIRNFIPAIEYLISEGYNVVRMGRHNKEKIDINHYYDYSKDFPISDESDFAWFNLAEFVISTGFGLEEGGVLLRKKVYLVNVVPLDCLKHCSVYPFSLPLVHFKRCNEQLMKVSEIYSRGADKCYTKQQMNLIDLLVASNAPQTIKKFVEQVVNYETDLREGRVENSSIKSLEAKPLVSKYWQNLNESASDENLLYIRVVD